MKDVAQSSAQANRALGSLVGLVAGDWVGVPLEFLPVATSRGTESGRWDPQRFGYVDLPEKREAERGEMQVTTVTQCH